MGIIGYMEMKDVEILPESPFKKKVLETQALFRDVEIDKDNMLLRFIIAKIPPDEYMSLVTDGYDSLRNKIVELGGAGFIKGSGFHPKQYGCTAKAVGCFVIACNKHHQMFAEKIMELYSDKEYVKECVKLIEQPQYFNENNPLFCLIVDNFSYNYLIGVMFRHGMDFLIKEIAGIGGEDYLSPPFCPVDYGYYSNECIQDCNKCHLNAIKAMKPYFRG